MGIMVIGEKKKREPSNVTKILPNVRKVRSNVMLVLPNVTIEPSFARKEKLNHQT